jgi:hypothetical protein
VWLPTWQRENGVLVPINKETIIGSGYKSIQLQSVHGCAKQLEMLNYLLFLHFVIIFIVYCIHGLIPFDLKPIYINNTIYILSFSGFCLLFTISRPIGSYHCLYYINIFLNYFAGCAESWTFNCLLQLSIGFNCQQTFWQSNIIHKCTYGICDPNASTGDNVGLFYTFSWKLPQVAPFLVLARDYDLNSSQVRELIK